MFGGQILEKSLKVLFHGDSLSQLFLHRAHFYSGVIKSLLLSNSERPLRGSVLGLSSLPGARVSEIRPCLFTLYLLQFWWLQC